MILLAAEAVRRVYGGRAVVDGAALTLVRGEVSCLLGPSGSGKSTLLRLLAGLESVDGGRVTAGDRVLSSTGTTVPPERRDIGLVFQDYALFPHLSVLDNVGFGLPRRRPAERRNMAMAELCRVGLDHRAAAFPHALSGGEQQRVALARALARRPAILLLDEPFSGLDGPLRVEVRERTLSVLREAGAAALIVTHDAEDALIMADRLHLMDAGRILQSGSPREVYARPASLAAARLLGEVDALPAEVASGVAHTAFGAIEAPRRADGQAQVLIRPEGLTPSAEGLPATVRSVRFAGHSLLVAVEAGGVLASVRLHPAETPTIGTVLRLALDPRFCTVAPP